MEIIWNVSFESRPNQNDFGSVTGSQIRQTKRAFKERFEVEHTFDETATALGSHRRGLCSVISTAATPPVSLGTRGGLQRNTHRVYFDSGTLALLIGVHSHLYPTGASPSDHPQYFETNRVSVDFDMTVKRFKGLDITAPIVGSNRILSRESHLPQVSGLAQHTNFAPEVGDAPTLNRFTVSMTSRTDYFTIVSVPATIEINLPPLSTFPHISVPAPGYIGSTAGLRFGPIEDNYADNRGRLRIYIPGTADTGTYGVHYVEVVP